MFICFFGTPSVFAQSEAVVIKRTAQLRAKPAKAAALILTVKVNTKLDVLSTKPQTGWYRVKARTANRIGWIDGNSIKITPATLDSIFELYKTEPPKNEWLYLSRHKFLTTYFNPAKIQHFGNGSISFWLKQQITNGNFYWQAFGKMYTDRGYSVEDQGGELNLDYQLTLFSGNCRNKSIGLTTIYLYDKQGGSIGPLKANRIAEPAPPDSVSEGWIEKVCEYVAYPH